MSRSFDLAAKGLDDPASLKPQEVREVCAALLAGMIADPPPDIVEPSGAGFLIEP